MVNPNDPKSNLPAHVSPNFLASPPPIAVNLDGIPALMRCHAQWLLWRWSYVDDKDKWTKVPVELGHHYATGRLHTFHLQSNEPANWLPFADVAAFVRVTQQAGRPFLGAAFRFAKSDPFAFVDLDHCRDRATGTIDPWALDTIRRFNSYTEASPSGTGVKIFVRGAKPGPRCRKAGAPIELYDSTQFSTVTGDRIELPGLSTDVEDRQPELSAMYAEMFPPEVRPIHSRVTLDGPQPSVPPLDHDDEWVINRLSSRPYWHGPNKSEEDFKLASEIAYWVGPDRDRIEQIMWCAPGRRPRRWNAGWLTRTIRAAIARRTRYYADLLEERRREDEKLSDPSTIPDIEALFARSTARRLERKRERERAKAETVADVTARIDAMLASTPPTEDEIREDKIRHDAIVAASARARLALRPPPTHCTVKKFLCHPVWRKLGVFCLRCRRWSCLSCSKVLKLNWSSHLRKILTESPDNLHFLEVDRSTRSLKRIVRRIERQDGNYVRIHLSNGHQLICSTIPFSPKDSTAIANVPPAHAVRRVLDAINAILIFGDTRKPIHASKRWRPPKPNPVGWKVLGGLPPDATQAEIAAAMEKLTGQEPSTRRPNQPFVPWTVECDFSGQLPADQPPPGGEADLTWMEAANLVYERTSNVLLGLPADCDNRPPEQPTEQFELDLDST